MIPERVSIDKRFWAPITEPDTVIGKKTPLFQGKATRVHWLWLKKGKSRLITAQKQKQCRRLSIWKQPDYVFGLNG